MPLTYVEFRHLKNAFLYSNPIVPLFFRIILVNLMVTLFLRMHLHYFEGRTRFI